jgi:RNA polymerase sigma-70 factor (ECF subfamily)
LTRASNDIDLASVEKIKQGDTAEFRLLVERYKDMSFSLACSILKDEHVAEDALQEVFIKVFRSLHKFRSKSSFSTWLYRIVVNTCFNIAKQQAHLESSDDPDIHLHSHDKEENAVFHSILADERQAIINSTLKTMKSEEALLLRLYYLSEMDIREIREVTGFSESKIKVTLHRGRSSFQSILHKLLGNELALFIK